MTAHSLPVHVPLVTQPLGLWGSLTAARRNILSIIPEIATRQPMVSGKTGKRWHMVMDPDALKQVLLEKLDDYPKSDVTKNLLRPAIGESLFVAEGAHWRWQRRAAAPAFSHRNVSNLAPIMSKAAENACRRITNAGPHAIDIHDEMVRATFEVISDVTFSGDDGFDRDATHRAIDNYIDQTARISLLDMLGAPDWVPRPDRIFAGRAVKQMKAVADRAIQTRKTRPQSGIPDLLDLLLSGQDPETKRTMNTAELRDNLLTFIVAGHETTALTLAWALYLCAFDQTIQSQARAEAQAALGSLSPATADDLPALPLIRRIVDESLRLYPPAALLSRTAQRADTLGGREIRSGDTVILPIYALHRNHLLWDSPDTFAPDRFMDRKTIRRFSYLPFGDGPRICIGASFALQEAVIILASLLARFRFTPVPCRTPSPVMILTLRPKGGVWLRADPV
ncbi:Cytochrome P450 [Thalassovita litoralis]|uniref:Cytochrome P450 n=1 Tax=Thalassovita litoralis TaxID=1010611 RepID=A0A521CMD0_9RHOB|nr:cytochrome P450 [Thalassovita litoralis]SMO59840.1 Cytochrome P450 [Thalassovita litoralis]